MKFPILAFILLVFSGSSTPAAQALEQRALPHPMGLVSGDASEVVIGRLNDDAVPDAAVLYGEDLYLICNPDRSYSFTKLAGPFYSMCKVGLSAVGLSDGDALLVTTDAGLSLVSWSAQAHALAASPAFEDLDWAAAEKLQAVQRDATSSTVVCGLSANGKAILIAEWNGVELELLSPIVLDTPPKALAGLYWDTDSKLDFATDDGSGLRITSSFGVLLSTFPLAFSAPQLLRLPVPGCTSCAESLVWLTGNPSGSQLLGVVHAGTSNQVVIDQVIDCQSSVVARLTLADFDADGKADLVATRSDQSLARVLYRQSGSIPFGVIGGAGGQNGMEIDLSSVVIGCGSLPTAAGDLDGDGDDDLVVAGQPSCKPEVHMVFANGQDQDDQRVWFGSGSFHPAGAELAPNLTLYPNDLPAAVAARGGMHVHIQVFGWAGGSSSLGVRLKDFSALMVPNPSTLSMDLPMSLPTNLVVLSCFEARDGTGKVLHSFPAWEGYINVAFGLAVGTNGGNTGGILPQPLPPPRGPNP